MSNPTLSHPETVEEAVAVLSADPEETAILAGGTWIMRAAGRGEPLPRRLISVRRLPSMHEVGEEHGELVVGAGLTHAALGAALSKRPALAGLRDAAVRSANPSVRNRATVGGNLFARGFAAADVVPALLAVDATATVASGLSGGEASGAVADIVADPPPGALLRSVRIPNWLTASSHRRLTLRAAGDYPVAIASVAATLAADGTVSALRIALGSVAERSFRWPGVEHALVGVPLDPTRAYEAAQDFGRELPARDSLGVPAWYRRAVVPALLRNAVEGLQSNPEEAA